MDNPNLKPVFEKKEILDNIHFLDKQDMELIKMRHGDGLDGRPMTLRKIAEIKNEDIEHIKIKLKEAEKKFYRIIHKDTKSP